MKGIGLSKQWTQQASGSIGFICVPKRKARFEYAARRCHSFPGPLTRHDGRQSTVVDCHAKRVCCAFFILRIFKNSGEMIPFFGVIRSFLMSDRIWQHEISFLCFTRLAYSVERNASFRFSASLAILDLTIGTIPLRRSKTKGIAEKERSRTAWSHRDSRPTRNDSSCKKWHLDGMMLQPVSYKIPYLIKGESEVSMRPSKEMSQMTDLPILSKCCTEIREKLRSKFKILSGKKVKSQRVRSENLKIDRNCLRKKLAQVSQSRESCHEKLKEG